MIDCVEQSYIDTTHGPNMVLSTFWRGAENFTQGQDTLIWAVSQGAPLRKVRATTLLLSVDSAQSSGGYFADCIFERVETRTQQQWCARNSVIHTLEADNISNFVLMGCTLGPSTAGSHLTVVGTSPVVIEKPLPRWLRRQREVCHCLRSSYGAHTPRPHRVEWG